MALNQYVGWGISTALLWLFNQNDDSSSSDSSLLSENNTTKIGSSVPVVLGRCMIKEPLVSYFGDFEAKKYTEEYSAHSQFDAKSLVLYLITTYIGLISTGHINPDATGVQSNPSGASVIGNPYGGKVFDVTTKVSGTVKDDVTGQLLNALWTWLLGWLINGRMLKTTVQKGFKYYLGWQFILCWTGNNIGIKNIWMNVYNSDIEESSQSAVWENNTASIVNNPTGIIASINNDDMFGGVDEGGGFSGDLRVYFGGTVQSKDSWMINQMSLDTVQSAVRGLTPLYSQYMTVVVPKAYIGKQATIPSIWFEIVNYPNNLGLAIIGNDLNPAEAIYEILINTNWGCSESSDNIDTDSLIKLGTTCATEGLGVSLTIESKTTAGDVIDKILTHINGVKFDSPTTGKLTFKLIRDDYDSDTLTVFDSSNCKSAEFSRLDWSDVASSVSVSYTDPDNYYNTSTLPDNDLANIRITKTLLEKTVDGTYFTTAANALALAKTELKSLGYPLASVSLETNRIGYGKTIGEAIKYRWLPYGIKSMIMRITDIDYGSLTDGTIKITALEDVFGFSKTEYEFSNGAEWTTVDSLPQDILYKTFIEMPYELSRSKDTYVYAMAVNPSATTVYWYIWRYINQAYTESAKASIWTASAKLKYGYSISYEDDSVGFEVSELGSITQLDSMIDIINSDTTVYNNTAGTNIMMIDGEILSFNTIIKLPNGDYQVRGIIRGIYDTLPEDHTTASIVYFMWNMINVTATRCLATKGNYVSDSYIVTTATVDKSQALDLTTVVNLTTKRRAEQPSIMANLKFGADMGINTLLVYEENSTISGNIKLTFLQRNKFNLYGIVSPTDTEVDGAVIEYADTTKNVIRITYNNITKEYMYDKDETNIIELYWAIVGRDFVLNTSTNFILDILTYDTDTLLYSYNKYSKIINWSIPQLIGVTADELTAQTYANSLISTGGILIPQTDYTAQIIVPYNLCPIIIIGSLATSGVKAQDGNNYSLTTNCYRIVGVDSSNNAILNNETLTEGYTLKSNFNTLINNYSLYYKLSSTNVFNQYFM